MNQNNKNEEEKRKIFLSACVAVAKADGEIDHSEVSAIFNGLIALGYSFTQHQIDSAFEKDSKIWKQSLDFKLLTSKTEKEALITTMLMVAYSDGYYSLEEQMLISETQRELQISDNRMLEIITIVNETRTALLET